MNVKTLLVGIIMGLMVTYGGELVRYNPANKHIEYSPSQGRTWFSRNNSYKNFIDLQDCGKEILASTDDGHIYYSTNSGRTWLRRR